MTDIRKLIVEAFAEQSADFAARQDEFLKGGDVSLNQFEIDSLTRFEILLKVEEGLDIEIDDDELLECTHLNQLIDVVTKKAGLAA